MRRLFCFTLSCFIIAFSLLKSYSNVSATLVSAKSYCLLNADTFEILDAKNAYQKLPMASTTKLMTALILADQNTPERVVITTKEMLTVEGSSMGLLVGDAVSFYDLLVGLMLPSGNDAANTVAIAIAGSVEAFADLMNKRAEEIGMNNTHFVTPSGLDAEGHYSTAYDMALLGASVLKNPIISSVVCQKRISVTFGNPPYERALYNHNKLLERYEYCIGLKTGYTKKSGRCLVSAAEKDGCRVVCATLNATNDWNDHEKLLSEGLQCVKKADISTTPPFDSIKVVGGNEYDVNISVQPFYCACSENTKKSITTKFIIQPFIYAPVKSGQTVGTAEFYCNGKIVGKSDIITIDNVARRMVKPSFVNKFIYNITYLFKCFI